MTAAPTFGDYRDPIGPARAVVVGVLIAAAFWSLVFCVIVLLNAAPAKHTRITEDDPRWNCRVDGNHVCGPAPADIQLPGGVR